MSKSYIFLKRKPFRETNKALELKDYARTTLNRASLPDWNFAFDKAKKRFGSCNYQKKMITLSSCLAEINSIKVCKETILHEIGHAMCPDNGHGYLWKAACKKLGLENPTRCYNPEKINTIEGKYQYQCPECGHVSHYYRKIKRNRSCGICSSVYDERFKLERIK